MIDGIYYQTIYLLIVVIFSFVAYHNYSNAIIKLSDSSVGVCLLALFMALFIGTRPVHIVFADTVGYVGYYNMLQRAEYSFDSGVENLLFDNILSYLASTGYDYKVWLTLIAFIYFIGRYVACKKLFPQHTSIAYLVFLGAFITYTSSVNGFKNGAATTFFVLAIAYRDKILLAICFLLLSWGFHHAMHVCIIAYVIAFFYNKPKPYFVFWVICLIIAIVKIQYFQILFGGWTDEKSAGYLMLGDTGWRTGMRYDFVLYSAIPIIQGWWQRRKYGVISNRYLFVLNIYTLLNGVWMLCMYASFTNRIAALSWGLYSIVILMPFFEKRNGCEIVPAIQNKGLSKVLLYNLLFTLFMEVIYYGVLK